MAVHAVADQDIETRVAEAAEATEALAREIFGDAAYLRRGIHLNPETGEELPAFEVHYCFDNWEEDFERLESLHNQFLDAYIRIVAPGLRSRIALNPIPTDADQPGRCDLAVQTAEDENLEVKISEAAATTEALARRFFGDAAYLRRDTEIDRETGEEDIVFEVHFCSPDPWKDFERLSALNQEFTSAFVRAVDGSILHRIILRPVPTDAD